MITVTGDEDTVATPSRKRKKQQSQKALRAVDDGIDPQDPQLANVGDIVEIKWDDGHFYQGKLAEHVGRATFTVVYDDGDQQPENLMAVTWRKVSVTTQEKSKSKKSQSKKPSKKRQKTGSKTSRQI